MGIDIQNLTNTVGYKGGSTVVLRRVFIIEKSYQQYLAIDKFFTKEQLTMRLVGSTIKRLSDNSPWFILVEDGLRFIFTVERDRQEISGRFVLTTVQKAW